MTYYNELCTTHHQPHHKASTNLKVSLTVGFCSQTIMATTPPSLTRYKLIFFVPVPTLEVCKAAVFAAGVGRYPGPGKYTECCFTCIGIGQFRPGDTVNPNIGKRGEFEQVQEARVETICFGKDEARKVVKALKRYVVEVSTRLHCLKIHEAWYIKTISEVQGGGQG